MTFKDFDMLGRKPLAEQLTRVIRKFSPFYREAFVLSLDGRFGSGKTTFLQMWKHLLETEHQMQVIYISAWQTDFENEPIVPIISAILEHVKKDGAAKKLADGLKTALGVAGRVALDVVEHVTGVDAEGAVRETQRALEAKDIIKRGEEVYREYQFKKDAYAKLTEALKAYVEKLEHQPLVILVDELDRARPDYSVKFLEAIKHIFEVQGVCFVLAVDRGQLEQSVKQLYGNVDFENYYRRFVTREARLEGEGKVDISALCNHLAEDFLYSKMNAGMRFAFKEEDLIGIVGFLVLVSKGFGMVPRELEGFYRTFAQLMAIEEDNQMRRFAKISWVKAAAFLTALQIKHPDFYRHIGKNYMQSQEILKFVQSIDINLQKRDRQTIMTTIFAFSACKNENFDNLDSLIDVYISQMQPYFDSRGPELAKQQAFQFLTTQVDTSLYKPAFHTIFEIIEGWREFI